MKFEYSILAGAIERERDAREGASLTERMGISRFGSMFGSSPAGATTTTSSPWAGQEPYLMQGMSGAEDLYQNYSPEYYPGQQVAQLNSAQTNALSGIESQAQTGEPITDAAMNFSAGLDNGAYLNSDPGNSYYSSMTNPDTAANSTLASYANGSQLNSNPYMDQVAQSVTSQVLPGIESQFISGGDLNNPSAAYAASQGVTSALAPVEEQAYQQEQQDQLGAAQEMNSNLATAGQGVSQNYQSTLSNMLQSLYADPSIQEMPYTDLNNEYAAGTQQQNMNQQNINAAQNEWGYYQDLPYQTLDQYMSTVGGQNYGSEVTQPYFENMGANALGGAVGGSQLAGLAGLTSSQGAGLGALLAML